MGGGECGDLLAWPLVIPKLYRVQHEFALVVDQNRPMHLSTRGDRANSASRAFSRLKNAANALDRPVPPVSWPLLRQAEAGHNLIVPPRVESEHLSRAMKKRRTDAPSSYVDCEKQVFLQCCHAASLYCRFVWRPSIIRCASGIACESSRTIASRRMRLVCSKRLPPNCRVVSIGVKKTQSASLPSSLSGSRVIKAILA